MDAFEAIALVRERLSSLEETLTLIQSKKRINYFLVRDTTALIDINKLMLIALYRTFQGHPIALSKPKDIEKKEQLRTRPIYRPELTKNPPN